MEIVLKNKPQMLILSGLPASGKSTRAIAWVTEDPDARIRINYDDLRVARYGPSWRFNRKEENEMKQAAFEIAKKALRAGLSVVIDNTNLTEGVRAHWRALGENLGAEVVYEEIDTDVRVCVDRDKLRDGSRRVGRAVIERMALFHGLLDWSDTKRYPNRFVICDIDGTLSDPGHRLHLVKGLDCDCGASSKSQCIAEGCGAQGAFKDWDKFHELVTEDTLKEPIARLLGHFRSLGYHILICSGRWLDKGCGKATEDWLDRHGIPYDHLFMRGAGDSREDSVIKMEILELLPKERIAYVLDDRPRVLRMWQAHGLTTLAVGSLNEF